MLTAVLIATAAGLAVLSAILLALLVRRRAAPSAPATETAPTADAEALLRDLYAALDRYSEAPPPLQPRREQAESETVHVQVARNPVDDLGELLAQMLRAARAIPGADAALAVVTHAGEPLVATSGLSEEEGERLASTLPAVGSRTRSIAITYDYGDTHASAPAGRIERGLAVPLSNLPSPGLLAILTRAPGATLGEPQLGMLEEICSKASPAFVALVERVAAHAETAA